ncbi:hypothetical protein FT663_02706 [Candidozyma haemuli var. vulneris]|nr:hypothetical protein FT662_03820 [[Candida] haemuloni var. vulneris]KAF3991520.1 hypothetical protein FT663_02706 [[Candida] haemuloni var. vulneris]
MEFTASEELISRPTSQYIKTLFEEFVDIFMGLSVQSTDQLSHDLIKRNNEFNSNDMQQDDVNNNDDFDTKKDDTSQSIPLLILFRCSLAFLDKCGVHDFNIMDLKKPESQRIRRILSAVINFARFREERMKDCEPIAQVCEEYSEDVRKSENEIVQVQNDIDQLASQVEENNQGQRKSTLVQLNNYNSRLEGELKKLQRSQEQLQLEHARYREQKYGLAEQIEDRLYLLQEEGHKVEKFKKFTMVNPTELQTILDDLKASLEEAEQQLRVGEATLQNRSKTIRAIKSAEDELKNILTIVQNIVDDLGHLDEEGNELEKQAEQRDREKADIEDIENSIRLTERQLSNLDEKILNTNTQASEKREEAEHRLQRLEEEYARLTDERGVREKKMDQNRATIQSLEEDINKMVGSFDREKRNIETAVASLNAHIRSYLSDMNSLQ